MDVILLEKVGKLGGIGDRVNVKSGFGRNFLLPTGKAVFATAENIVAFEDRRAELESTAQGKLADAEAKAEKLAALESVVISAVAGEEGKLFGSVGPRDVAEACTLLGVDLSKSEVKMPDGAIRDLGEHEVQLQLHTDVALTITVLVSEELPA